VFKGKKSDKPVLVIAGGANRVNTQSIAKLTPQDLQNLTRGPVVDITYRQKVSPPTLRTQTHHICLH